MQFYLEKVAYVFVCKQIICKNLGKIQGSYVAAFTLFYDREEEKQGTFIVTSLAKVDHNYSY